MAEQKRHRDAKKRQAVDEVGGAVDGIDAPQTIGSMPPHLVLLLAAHLLAQNRPVDEGSEPLAERLLRRQVHLGEHGSVGLVLAHRRQVAAHDDILGDAAHGTHHALAQW